MLELETSREKIRILEHQIGVQDATIRELQYQCDNERQMKKPFRRYTVTMQTLIGTISRAASLANDAATEHAVKEEPRQVSPPSVPPQSQVEADIEAAVKGMKAGAAPAQ